MNFVWVAAFFCASLFISGSLLRPIQTLKEVRVPYASRRLHELFWVAQRSALLKNMDSKSCRFSCAAAARLSRRSFPRCHHAPTGKCRSHSGWAQGAKDLVVLGATGNKLDYVFVSGPAIKSPRISKAKVAISQLGASTEFIARLALRQLGLNEKEVTLLGIGAQGERWAALAGGHVDASVFQPPITLRARKAGLPIWVDFSKSNYEFVVAGPVTLRSFIKSERETVMNFMRGLADGMDFTVTKKQRRRA
jgi:hypothetical protein